ncbi:MAG: LacI family DNA-binding transcriptional regulator [Spirochaetes bacterium]|nr:LacI family DNA-binding transcriptional regulator [Spirochaetota bacterium]
MPTIKDVAKLADCSIRTVSRVLNNSGIVKEVTRVKILKITKDLGFVPDPQAKSLKTKRKYTIGLIHNGITSDVNRQRVETITRLFNIIGYAILINYADNIKLEEEIINKLKVRADALIIFTSMEDTNSKILDKITEEDYPFILIDPFKKVDYPAIYINRITGYKEAVIHLAGKGRKKIALFINSYRSNERLEGYKRGLSESNLEFKENLIIHSKDNFITNFDDIENLFDLINGSKIDSVICHNDKVAVSLMHHLNQKNIKVPENISVIGFDNDAYAQFACSPLTTIAHPGSDLGVYIYEQLHNKLEYNCPIENKTFDTNLIVRMSS